MKQDTPVTAQPGAAPTGWFCQFFLGASTTINVFAAVEVAP
jgi:hypothetical protein